VRTDAGGEFFSFCQVNAGHWRQLRRANLAATALTSEWASATFSADGSGCFSIFTHRRDGGDYRALAGGGT
jgi:hypothetical protein